MKHNTLNPETSVSLPNENEIDHPTSVTDSISSTSSSSRWKFFGQNVPKSEVVYISQMFIIFVVIVSCIINLSLKNGNSEMWVSFFGYAFGAMLPPPKLQIAKPVNLLKH